ncbi:unnamed protein product [Ambrosiozyma monospora]|uniref:Unnamed protein product n=1 Tax=Ambrosiozyma monospora TaxID=43982 RepID=A0ACB5T433_AMBMO|nr:unnamed protein product [Ambrosiozyma monospora]
MPNAQENDNRDIQLFNELLQNYNEHQIEKNRPETIITGNPVTRSRLDQITNWNALVYDKPLMVSMSFYLIFMISEVLLSYVAFVYADVSNKPLIYDGSMIFNIFSAYTVPFITYTSMEDNVLNPFQNLRTEVRGCQAFLMSILTQLLALALAIWAVVSTMNDGPYTYYIIDYQTNKKELVDATITLKVFAVISMVMVVLGFIATTLNYWFARDRLLRYLNRVELVIADENVIWSNDSDLELPEVYDHYLKTMRTNLSIPM